MNQTGKEQTAGSLSPAKMTPPGVLRQLRLTAGFFTVLPLARSGSLEEIAASGYLLPALGVLLGLVEGPLAWCSWRAFGPGVAAALTLAAALLLTGLHHADGLADMGDALMVHGDTTRRIGVLKDRTMGIGAAGALIITYLLTWTGLAQLLTAGTGLSGAGAIFRFAELLMVAETAARLSLLMTAALSRPSHAGSGSIFIIALNGWRAAAGLALAGIILASTSLGLGILAVAAAAAAAAVTALAVTALARRLFGGAGGDVLGASLELGRMAALLGLLAVLLPRT